MVTRNTQSVSVTLTQDKVTKNTVRFVEAGDSPLIGTLYVPQSTLRSQFGVKGDEYPRTITVSVSL